VLQEISCGYVITAVAEKVSFNNLVVSGVVSQAGVNARQWARSLIENITVSDVLSAAR